MRKADGIIALVAEVFGICAAGTTLLVALLPGEALAQSCRQVSIREPVPFSRNNNEIPHLDEGSIRKVQYEYEYLYEYYPSVLICPDQGKVIAKGKALNVTALSSPITGSGPPNRGLGQSRIDITGQVVVVAARSDCHDYFLADGPKGYYLLEWYGGYSPSAGDVIVGDLGSYGFKDVFYPGPRSAGRLYIDDFLLSHLEAIEKYSEKCR